jgi:hypothetical protein
MKTKFFISCVFLIGFYSCQPHASDIVKTSKINNIAEFKKLFVNPPSEYRSAPLWVWNDRVTKQTIKEQLTDFKSKGIGGVFVHPRPGLITPYLSQEWIDLFKYAVSVGKELGMKIWIYDEDTYPSGFAGGHVMDVMPEAVMKQIKLDTFDILPAKFDKEIVAVFQKKNAEFHDITGEFNKKEFPSGKYLIFFLKVADPSPWFGGFGFVDLMQKKVTEKFLELTLEPYRKAFGDEFGKTVPGSFQDEPGIFDAEIADNGCDRQIPFTPALFETFQKIWKYDLRTKLPLLYFDEGDYKAVRYQYYTTLRQLFIENWNQPYHDYCVKNNLQYTGHNWENRWPVPRYGDPMAQAMYASVPGIDLLRNQFGNAWNGQFGADRYAREVRSVASQCGQNRIVSETYGVSGWDLTFEDQKRIVDWEVALGINFICQHLQYMTFAGARKRDCPLSFSYHEPWWNNYTTMGDYIGRISLFGASGEQINKTLVIEPTTTGWMNYSPLFDPLSTAKGNDKDSILNITQRFNDFIRHLEAEQVEYDMGSEYIMEKIGKVSGKELIVGNRSYNLIVLPSTLENISSGTLKQLESYLRNGGTIFAYTIPGYLDGVPDKSVKKLSKEYTKQWVPVDEKTDIELINKWTNPEIKFKYADSGGLLYHHRRQLDDAQLIFLVNTSDSTISNGQFQISGGSVEKLDAFSGEASSYPFIADGDNLKINYSIPVKGSLLLCISKEKKEPVKPVELSSAKIQPSDKLKVKRLTDNILTIDYCDLILPGNYPQPLKGREGNSQQATGNKTTPDMFFYDAEKAAFSHFNLVKDPWDNGVQFKTSYLDKDTFNVKTNFSADFWFTVSNDVDPEKSGLKAVVERPQIFKVFINDVPVIANANDWWLDKNFGVYDIGKNVKPGKNKITVKVQPMSIFAELESIYILGDFNLVSADKGFKIIKVGELELGSWKNQGLPMYSNNVVYGHHYNIVKKPGIKYVIKLNKWKGTVANVNVNGKNSCLFCRPYELDITGFVKDGDNSIKVTVTGSLKNTLGPFHGKDILGAARPAMFQKGNEKGYPPGDQYNLRDYGLVEDFDLYSYKQ